MRERAVSIGRPTPLNGVISEPSELDPSKPALLILNSGVMHHVGSCRLSVKIARAAAAGGVTALRFDFSGVGDSEPRRNGEPLEKVWRSECSEVMDYLQSTRGIERFILFGLCSGADVAYETAVADERVVAFIQVDGYGYVNWRFYVARYRPIIFRKTRWKNFLRRIASSFTSRKAETDHPATGQPAPPLELPAYRRVVPPREEVAKNLSRMIGRGVRMYVNFTGGEAHYNYPGQYLDTFRDVAFGDALKLDYYPQTNHIVTQPLFQQELVNEISSWVVEVARLGEGKSTDKMPRARSPQGLSGPTPPTNTAP